MNPRLIEHRLTRLAGQGHDAVTGAVRAWAGAVEQVAGAVPDPGTVVRAYFGVAEEVLRVQRAIALDVLRLAGGSER
jgi:hypothetical protein